MYSSLSSLCSSLNGWDALTGDDALPPEEKMLLLDNYDSDGEGENKPEPEEDADQGCLKVMHGFLFIYFLHAP